VFLYLFRSPWGGYPLCMNPDTIHTEATPSPSQRWQRLLHRASPLPGSALTLPDSGTWSADVHEPVEIRVLSGMAWITQEGDVEDHVVEAPSSFLTKPRGRVAVMALAPVEFAVAPALRSAA